MVNSAIITGSTGGDKGGIPVRINESVGVIIPVSIAHLGIKKNPPTARGQYMGKKTLPNPTA